MQYILLIYENEQLTQAMTEAEGAAQMAAYGKFTADVRAAGVMVSGEPLEPTPTATSVRVRDGSTLVTDGPFAETREQLGGFYILDCATLDDAVAWAAQIPTARVGTIEVRPIMALPQP
jgi:hypothetical protein